MFGGSDSSLFYTNDGYTYDLSSDDNKVQFIYDIGNFIDYTNGEEKYVISEIDEKNKEIALKWTFETNDEWDKFNVKVMDSNLKLIANDTHQWLMDDKFNKVTTNKLTENNNKLEFIKYLNCNNIPDGDLNVSVAYIVEMTDSYDKREKVKDCIIENFTYPTPKLTLDNVQPYVVITFDRLTNVQKLSLACDIISDYNEEELKNTKIKIKKYKENQIISEQNFDTSYLKYTYAISNPKKDYMYDFVLSGANYYDNFARNAYTENAELCITDDINKSLTLPNDGIDYIGTDVANLYTIIGGEDDGKVVDWTWIKEHTLHDINKTFQIKDTSLFGASDMNYVTFNGETRRILFDVVTLNGAKKYIRRFIPHKKTVTVTEDDIIELKNFNDIITSSSFSSFSQATDRG